MRAPLVLVLAVVLVGALAGPSSRASAQTSSETPGAPLSGRDVEARALFDAAVVAMDSGRYENALEYFERSYALSERAELLFNIGSAAERLRYDARALAAFQGYLAALPAAENREAVLARIGILERSLAAAAREASSESTAEPTSREVDASAASGAGPSTRGPSVPVIVVGSGVMVAALGVGGYWIERQRTLDGCVDDTSDSQVCVTRDDIRGQRNVGRALSLTLAGAGLATTIVGLFVGRRPARDADATAFACAPTTRGLACAGTF